jgi:hypothetical protein
MTRPAPAGQRHVPAGPRNLGVFRLKAGYRSNSKEGICPVGVRSGVTRLLNQQGEDLYSANLQGYVDAQDIRL